MESHSLTLDEACAFLKISNEIHTQRKAVHSRSRSAFFCYAGWAGDSYLMLEVNSGKTIQSERSV